MSTQGPFSGQYFGDYYGDYLGATAGVTPGWMVGSAHISLSATGVLTAATPQPSLPAAAYGAGGSRADRARPRIGRFPDLRAPEFIKAPARRLRRKREGDWLIFSGKH